MTAIPILPESAPFSGSQRAWLNGFFAGVFGLQAVNGTAFSRDQREKVYVQHRLKENAREVWTWLEQGAHVYVCGDARRMALDVDHALHAIVVEQGGLSPERAKDYMRNLGLLKRYQRDVY